MHYAILALNSRQQRAFMERYIRHARTAAWGETGVPGLADIAAHTAAVEEAEAAGEATLNRAQRRMKKVRKTGSGSSTPVPGDAGKRRVVAENGKVLIVDSAGDVYLEGKDEDGGDVQYLLDLNDIQGPRLRDTFLVRLPMWVWGVTVGRVVRKEVVESDSDSEEERKVGRKVERNGESMPRRKVTRRKQK